MIRLILGLFSIFAFVNGNAQMSKTDSLEVQSAWKQLGVIRAIWDLESYDITIAEYADSLNYVSKESLLPRYLYNPLFDFLHYQLLFYYNKEITSLRKAIFDRVYNEEALRRIVELNNSALDGRYEPEKLKKERGYVAYQSYPQIPYMSFSTRELAKRRLEQIQVRKDKSRR